MIRKTVKYTDLNGEAQEENFYFNLNKVEAIQLTAQAGGDITAYAESLAESGNLLEMINFIQELILSSVGMKDVDGKRFIKSPAIRSDFENSVAYAELFEELLTDPVACKEFGEGLVSVPSAKDKAATPQAPKLEAVPTPKPSLTPEQQLAKILAENPELANK